MAAYLSLHLSESSYSADSNTSEVYVKLSITSEGSFNYDNIYGYIVVGGTTYEFYKGFNKYSTTTLFERTITIPHYSDGSKTVSAYASYNTHTSSKTLTASNSLVLTNLARATVPKLNKTDVNAGGTVTIDLRGTEDPRYTHGIWYRMPGQAWQNPEAAVKGTYNLVLPENLLQYLPAYEWDWCEISVTTYLGNRKIGENTAWVKLHAGPEIKPTVSNITFSDDAIGPDQKALYEKYGGFVQYKSMAKVTVHAVPKYSPVTNYKVTTNGRVYNSKTGTIPIDSSSAGQHNLTAVVVDQRGRQGDLGVFYNVFPYETPVAQISAKRCNKDGTLNDDGNFAKVHVIAQYSALNNRNTAETVLSYKKQTVESFTEAKRWSAYNVSEDIIIPADSNSGFDLKLSVKDDFSQLENNSFIETARDLINFNTSGNGIAFGKVSESDSFECNIPADFLKNTKISGMIYDLTAEFIGQHGNSFEAIMTLLLSNNCEYGEKDGWSWLKYSNGIAFAFKHKNWNCAMSAWNYIYSSPTLAIGSFPFTFAEPPKLFATPTNSTGFWKIGETGKTASNGGSIYVGGARPYGNVSISMDILIVGRWM